MIENLVTIVLISVENISMFYLLDAFLQKKHRNIKMYFLVTTVAIYTVVAMQNIPLLQDNSRIKVLIVLIVLILTAQMFFEGRVIAKGAIASLGIGMFYAIDYAAIAVTMMIFKISYFEVVDFSRLNAIISALSKFMLLTICATINRLRKVEKIYSRISDIEWAQMMIFPGVSLVIMLAFVEVTIKVGNASTLTLSCILGIIIANIAIFAILNKLEQEKMVKEENTILQQKVKIEMNNVTALMQAYATQRKSTHDFSNHLAIIDSLAKAGDIEKLKEYTSGLSSVVQETALVVSTNNLVIDALLNQKYAVAQKNDISVEFMINDLKTFPMKGEDAVIVLSNAIDNAIEACLQMEKGREIKIKIMKKQDETTILIKNTVKFCPTIIDNNVVSDKSNKLDHGYGIRNINAVLAKYGVSAIIKCSDGWFQIAAIIC